MNKIKLSDAVDQMFIGPFGSALKNDCFVDESQGYCMVYEQKHAINKTIDKDNRYITFKKYNELKRFEVTAGDIIMSCRGTVGELFLLPDGCPNGIIHPSLMKIRVKKDIFNPEFLIILLKNKLKNYNNDGTSVKMAIKAKDLGNMLFPVPTLAEQEKLIKKLNTINCQIENNKMLLNNIETLIFSKYEEMFDSENEKIALSELCDIHARIGWQGLTKKEYLNAGIFKLITGVDFTSNNRIDFDKCVYVSEERYMQDVKIQVKENDILVTKDGTIGKVAIVKNLKNKATLNSGVFVVRPKDNSIYPEYLMYSFLSYRFRNFIEKLKTGATIPHLNQKAFINYRIFKPSIEEQEKFKKIIDLCDYIKENIVKVNEKLELMYNMIILEFFN